MAGPCLGTRLESDVFFAVQSGAPEAHNLAIREDLTIRSSEPGGRSLCLRTTPPLPEGSDLRLIEKFTIFMGDRVRLGS